MRGQRHRVRLQRHNPPIALNRLCLCPLCLLPSLPRTPLPRVIPLAVTGRRQRPVTESDSTQSNPIPPRRVGFGPRPSAGAATEKVERTSCQRREQPDRVRQGAGSRAQHQNGPIPDHPEPARAHARRHRQPADRRHRAARRPAEFTVAESLWPIVRHHELDHLG